MSIYYSGALKRSAGVMSAITKQMKSINLKGVKRINVTFDPFDAESKATSLASTYIDENVKGFMKNLQLVRKVQFKSYILIILLREFLFLLSTPKATKTNPNCVLKTDIVCDRRKPEIKFSLIDSVQEQAKTKEIRFVSNNLNTLELLQLCNKYVSKLAPVEEIVVKATTKLEKQKLAGKSTRRK